MFVAASLLAFAPVIVALLPVLKIVVPAAVTLASGWLYYRAERFAKAKTDNEVIPRALEEFFQTVTRSVLIVQQTFIDDLIEKSADGTLTESEKRQALSRAGQLVMSMLPPSVEEILRAYYGPRFTDVIEGEIEATVSKLKPHFMKALTDKVKRADLVAELRENAMIAAKEKAAATLDVDPSKKK